MLLCDSFLSRMRPWHVVTFSFWLDSDTPLSNIPFCLNGTRFVPQKTTLKKRLVQVVILNKIVGTSPGLAATFTPAFSRASILLLAVPVLPVIIAPACPMRFSGGAVGPAM